MMEERNISRERTVRQLSRAILIDDAGNLLLFRRNKPDQPLYWATPGGYVERSDQSAEATLERELAEELNAQAANIGRVFVYSYVSADTLVIEHFFVARLVAMDETAPRIGPEFEDPAVNGTYELERIPLLRSDLATLNLLPKPLKDFIIANKRALIALAEKPGDLA